MEGLQTEAGAPAASSGPVSAKQQTGPGGAAVAAGSGQHNAAGGSGSSRSRKKDKSKRKGRGHQQAEEVDLGKSGLSLVRLRYEGKRPDPADEPHIVQLSKLNKASKLLLSEDRMSVTGHKGFRSARCSHGSHEGTWYCEAKVVHLGSTGHARLGWGTKRAELNAPMGFDEFGFSYRDLEGSKVYNGKREPYGEAYGEGDVIGLWIHLPPGGEALEVKHNQYTKWKGKWMRIEDPEPAPKQLPGSLAGFCKNGVFQGIAFQDFKEGTYYPAASLYTMPEQSEGATVSFNFGPNFRYPPPQVEGCPPARPMSDLAAPEPEPPRPPTPPPVAVSAAAEEGPAGQAMDGEAMAAQTEPGAAVGEVAGGPTPDLAEHLAS